MPNGQPFDPNEFGQEFDPNEFGAPPQQNAPKSQVPPASPGFMDTISSYIPQSIKTAADLWEKPLTDYVTDAAGNKIFDPQAAANFYDNPANRTEDQWKIPSWVPIAGGGTFRSLGAGMLEGAGDVVRGFTSPQNIAMTGATMGAGPAAEAGYTGAAQAMRTGARIMSAPMAAHGAYKAATGESPSERGFGVAEMAGGIAGMVPHPSMPVRTPRLNEVKPTIEAPLVDHTAQMMLDFQNKANDVIHKSPSEQAVPQQPKVPESQAIAQEHTQAQPQLPPEMVPVGGEETFNANRPQQPEQTPAGGVSEEQIYRDTANRHGMAQPLPPNLDEAAAHINETVDTAVKQAQQQAIPEFEKQSPDMEEAIAAQHEPSTGIARGANIPGSPEIRNGIRQPAKEYPGYKGEIGNEASVASEATPEDIANARKQGVFSKVVKDEQGKLTIFSNRQPKQGNLPLSGKALQLEHQDGLIRTALARQKSILTAWDLSAPGRQGKAFMANKEWWTSLDDMVKAWGSKDAAKIIDASIEDHPSGYFKKQYIVKGEPASFADKVGLDLAPHEEIFQTKPGKFVSKLGLVERSSRAHTAFLNKLRSDIFARMMDLSKKAGQVTPETELMYGKKYADFINNATGRGSLKISTSWNLERNAKMINDVFFAPKNMAGQIRTWGTILDPRTYSSADPVMRNQALRSLFAVAGMGTAVSMTAKLGGADVSLDPTSADFLKIKFGNTRFDNFGGYGQLPVAAAKLIWGQSTSTVPNKQGQLTTSNIYNPGYGKTSAKDVAERYFVNRLAPLPSFIWALATGREYDGQPFEVKKAIFQRTFPIALNDLIQLSMEDPTLGLIATPTTMLGITNTQTYSGR